MRPSMLDQTESAICAAWMPKGTKSISGVMCLWLTCGPLRSTNLSPDSPDMMDNTWSAFTAF